MSAALRLFCALNGALLVGLIAWMVGSYVVTGGERERVAVPAFFEAPSEAFEPLGLEGGWGELGDEPESPSERPVHPLHRRAGEAYQAGQFDRAIALLRAALGVRPEDPILYNDLGIYLRAKNLGAEAVAAFERAVALDPAYARAFYNLGTSHLRDGRPDQAIQPLEKALEINPYYSEARHNLARALTQRGETSRAIEEYRLVVQSDRSTGSAKSYYNLGLLLARQDSLREGLAAFRQALRLRPDYVKARFAQALLLVRMGAQDEAMEQYRLILDIEPEHAGSLVNLAVMNMRGGEWREAIQRLDRAITADPGNAQAFYNLGLCHVNLEDDVRAVGAFESAVRHASDYPEAHYNAGLALGRLGRLEEAIAHFSEAAAQLPERPEYHYNLALALAAAERQGQAIEAYQTALRLEPDYFKARYNLALSHYRSGDLDSALSVFRRAVDADPAHYGARYNLGLTLLKLKRPAEAADALGAALALEPTLEAHYNLGLALARQGLAEEALESFRTALEIDPKHGRSIEKTAEAYMELGRHDEALQVLLRLQRLDPRDPTAFNGGLRLYRDKRYSLAARYFEVAAQGIDPIHPKSLSMWGLALARQGKLDAATDLYRRAVAQFPDHPRLRRNFAWVLGERGEHAAAIEQLEAVLAANSRDVTALYDMGKQQRALGESAAARRSFQRVLEIDPSHRRARSALTELPAPSL